MRVHEQTRYILGHKCIIDGDNVDVFDSFRLVLVMILDILRYLRTARGRECAGNTELKCIGMIGVIYLETWSDTHYDILPA